MKNPFWYLDGISVGGCSVIRCHLVFLHVLIVIPLKQVGAAAADHVEKQESIHADTDNYADGYSPPDRLLPCRSCVLRRGLKGRRSRRASRKQGTHVEHEQKEQIAMTIEAAAKGLRTRPARRLYGRLLLVMLIRSGTLAPQARRTDGED